ncbi:conserved hypothetical protein [Aspergillus udagawae]|uniref:Uncharacterized protein n=1 Tax=Aspergillus udagawae TaxID=91492 RepID=A0A8H3RRM3_9EURO|nr:conserved hypothetical protein [Aspergillus udagawae]
MIFELFNQLLLPTISSHDAWRDAGDISEWAWSTAEVPLNTAWVQPTTTTSTVKVLLRRTIQQPLHTRISNALFSLLLSTTCFSLGRRLDSQFSRGDRPLLLSHSYTLNVVVAILPPSGRLTP